MRARHAQVRLTLGAYALAAAALAVLIWVSVVGWACAPGRVYLAGQCNSVAGLLVPLLIAYSLWGIACAIWRSEPRTLTAEFYWLSALCLASGALSAAGSFTAGQIFNLALIWLAPLTVGFHLGLLGRPPSGAARAILRISLALAVLWTAPFLVATVPQLQAAGVYAWLRVAMRLTLALALAAGVISLARGYRTGLPLPAARRVQVLALGAILAFAPLLLLSLIPETLSMPVFMPYELTLPWLLLSPLTYLYASYRRRLSRIEPVLRQLVIYFALAILVLAAFFVACAVLGLPRLLSARLLLAGVVLSGLSVVIYAYLQPELVALTRWSLQGRRTPAVMLEAFAEALSLAHDGVTLEQLLLHRLPAALGAPGIMLLTRQGEALCGELAAPAGATDGERVRLPAQAALATRLAAAGRPLSVGALRQPTPDPADPAADAVVLAQAGLDLCVPLVAGGRLQGVLGLGPKLSEDAWSADDLYALAVLGRQAGAALQNRQLLDEVQAGRDELARAHRQLLVDQDRSQRELARELHDGPVQQLLGISYQLAQARRTTAESATIRREVLTVADQLRDVIGRLRPAGLSELGLPPALRDYVARLQRATPGGVPRLRLHIEPADVALPPELAICLFRCAQEGLRNALRHARPSTVIIALRVSGDQAQLVIQDDGCGFAVPQRLSELAQADHFGIIGIAERVEWLGGHLAIESRPETGTTLRVTIPRPALAYDSEAPNADPRDFGSTGR